MMTEEKKYKDIKREWFGEWFDSPYYHILYKHRDHEEARAFIDRLCGLLKFSASDKILDLACGKGRHSIYLNQKGLDVAGLDLSEQNIRFARQFENDRLRFFVHDMREDYSYGEFDYILNLFTSFGYFETEEENERVMRAAARALKKNGKALIDFLNPYKVIHNLVSDEVKTVDGIRFKMTRKFVENKYIQKDIEFRHNGKSYKFRERVMAVRRVQFLEYFDKAGLRLIKLFGDYELNGYVAEESERMIFLVQK